MIAERQCGTRSQEAAVREPGEFINGFDPRYSSSGTYRTLCVRTCDGYYFPISYSTTSDQFGADAQTCAAMCPAAESRLYYYPNPGGGPEDMVSVYGEPYSSLQAAFQYRTSFNPSCTCRSATGYSAITADTTLRPSLDPAALGRQAALIPRSRPEPGEDPETLANRIGGFALDEPVGSATSSVASAPVETGGEQSVRVVGPAYGPSREQQEVILTPVPN
jgi:hypothetical protein